MRFLRPFVAALSLAAIVASPLGARASLIACADPCTIDASINGYLLPLTDIRAGASVQWQGIDFDVSHPTAEAGMDPCFLFPAGALRVPVPIRFDVVDGGVTATQPYIGPGTQYPVGTNPCTSATHLDDGSFLLQFHCLVHPWMYGALRIEP